MLENFEAYENAEITENKVIEVTEERNNGMAQNIENDQIVEADLEKTKNRQDIDSIKDISIEQNSEVNSECPTADTIETENVEDNAVENENSESEDSACETETGSTTEKQEEVQSENYAVEQSERIEKQKQNTEIDEKAQEKMIWSIFKNSIFRDYISDKFIIFTLDNRMIKCDKKEVKFAIASLLRHIKFTKQYSENLLNKFEKYFTEDSTYNDFLFKVKEFDIQNICTKPNIIKIHNKFFNLDTQNYCPDINNDISQIKICYNKDATAPNWEKFIDDITCNDKAYAHYLQKVVGSWLYGSNVQQAAFILTGNGANGKTVFMETLKKVFGTYASVIDKNVLMNDSPKTKIEYRKLIGKRIAIINELENSCQIKIDVFKRLTGNDTVDFNYKDRCIEFINKAKFVILTNTIPLLDGYDYGVERRIKILPFNNKFIGDKRDLFIMDTLEMELDGILNWILDGYHLWKKEHLDDEPDFITEMLQNHILGNDPIEEFIQRFCDIDNNYKCKVSYLYGQYIGYCKNFYREPVGKNKFGELLDQKGFTRIRLSDGQRGYKGLKPIYHANID